MCNKFELYDSYITGFTFYDNFYSSDLFSKIIPVYYKELRAICSNTFKSRNAIFLTMET